MTFAQFFIVAVTVYAIVLTVLFMTLRSAFNDFIQAQIKIDDNRSKAVDDFLHEVQWLIDHTESEEVEKSVTKLKQMMERVQ